MSTPRVVAVSRDGMHRFSKVPADSITLVAGLGVVGDAHAGMLVQHRSRVRRDPNQPNLRQVHLIHSELFDEARDMGFELGPGDLGENVLTAGLDLLALPTGTLLCFGDAVVRVTGLRNPCAQINTFRPGLLKVVLSRPDGTPTDQPAPSTGSPDAATAPLIRKAGVMAVVERGGAVTPDQLIEVTLPYLPHHPWRRSSHQPRPTPASSAQAATRPGTDPRLIGTAGALGTWADHLGGDGSPSSTSTDYVRSTARWIPPQDRSEVAEWLTSSGVKAFRAGTTR